jgi:small subunit ribosomal protein S17
MEETKENVETTPAAAPVAGDASDRGKRTEKIGIVTSDKMQKTVVVRVDRLVKHPVYKRYVKKRAKFMAHSEIEGVSIGDQVRIVETRPLSAHKRWRVVEVLRKASK